MDYAGAAGGVHLQTGVTHSLRIEPVITRSLSLLVQNKARKQTTRVLKQKSLHRTTGIYLLTWRKNSLIRFELVFTSSRPAFVKRESGRCQLDCSKLAQSGQVWRFWRWYPLHLSRNSWPLSKTSLGEWRDAELFRLGQCDTSTLTVLALLLPSVNNSSFQLIPFDLW